MSFYQEPKESLCSSLKQNVEERLEEKNAFGWFFVPNVHEIKCILTNLHSYTNNKNVIYFNDFFIFADSK